MPRMKGADLEHHEIERPEPFTDRAIFGSETPVAAEEYRAAFGADDGADDGAVALVLRQAHHKGAVDLELGDGKFLQVGQAGVAGAKVVNRQAHAQAGQRVQAGQCLIGILHEDGLGELQLQQRGGQFGIGNASGHALHKIGLLELQG